MRYFMALVLIIGGVVYGVDQCNPPTSQCQNSQLGCSAMKSMKSDGVIDGFDKAETESGWIISWEINDDDSFLVNMNYERYQVSYPTSEETLAKRIDSELQDYRP
jgi:hypothetical protein